MGQLVLTLEDGRTGTVDVDNSFGDLPADKQSAVVDDIKSQLSTHPSFGADLQGGIRDAMTGLAQGANTIGGVMARNGIPGAGGLQSAGSWLQSNAPAAPVGPTPVQTLTSDLKAGNYSALPGDVAHAVVRAAPGIVPIVGGGLLGGAVAGPAGAAIGAGLASGAESVGPVAYDRAANNGRTAPDTSDVVQSLPAVAADAAAGAILPGNAGAATGPLMRAALRVGRPALTVAGMDAANQLGGSVGTDQGAQFDPYQTAGAALTGAGMGAPGAARGAVKGTSDQLMARTLEPPTSPEAAQSVVRVNQAMDAAKANAANSRGVPMSDTMAANVVRSNLTATINDGVKQLAALGMIDRADASALRAQITNEAGRSDNAASADLFARIDGLDTVPQVARDGLKNAVMDLDTASTPSIASRTAGPFQRIGGVGGKAAAVLGGIHVGSPEAIVGGLLGRSPAGAVGSAVGSAVDRVMGTDTPTVRLQQINAARMLRAVGIDPSTVAPGSSISDLLAARPLPPQPSIPRQALPGFEPVSPSLPTSPAEPTEGIPSAPPPTAPDAPAYNRAPLSLAPGPRQVMPATGVIPRAAAPGFAPDTTTRTVAEPAPVTPTLPPSPSAALSKAQGAIGVGPATFRQAADPITGNLPDPVPVNTAIPRQISPGQTPTGGANLPPLRIDTPTDVRAAVAQDGTPSATGVWTGAHSFVANGNPMVTADMIHQWAGMAEAKGQLPPGTTEQLRSGQLARIPPAQAAVIQAIAPAELGLSAPEVVKAASNRVRNPLSYAANLAQEQGIALNIASQHPELVGVVNAIRDPSANGKTKAGRAATLAAYLATIGDQAERARQEQILKPLTAFGQ